MTVRTALQQGQKLLEDAGVSAPQLTAEVLLMHAVSLEIPCDRAWLYAHANDELRELWWIHYGRYLHERTQGKPTQYIVGRQEFFGRDFKVTPDVLIPRPETEHLVDAALKNIAINAALANAKPVDALRILDIGTGSGAIAITLALETKAHVFATDLSLSALRVAAANARTLDARVSFVASDLGSALAEHSFDIVVSNPPYIPAVERPTLQREVRDHEPSLALFGGDDGLDIYRRLIPEARRLLTPGGWLIMELGQGGLFPVRKLLVGWDGANVVKDLAGIDRVIAARKPSA
jgi:release factor glutamine methyltransferase